MLKSRIACCNCDYVNLVPSETLHHRTRHRCPKCQAEIDYRKNIFFENSGKPLSIYSSEFMHPLDKTALNAIKAIPYLGIATKKMMKATYEKYVRVAGLADDIKVTQKTCSYIWDMAVEASRILGVRTPDVYINQNPIVNAYTTGVENPIVVINSGLIELCDDDELYATVAHEIGHIKCEHVLYHMLAEFISQFPDLLGVAKLVTAPLSVALLEWSRKSELSADRAAFLVTRNRERIISLLMKLAGGSSKLFCMIEYDDFASQYQEWEDLMRNLSDKLLQKALTMFRTHPFPIIRAYELNKWVGETKLAVTSQNSEVAVDEEHRSIAVNL